MATNLDLSIPTLIDRAVHHVLAQAETEAIERGIPLDGSWRLDIWTEFPTPATPADLHLFRIAAQWRPAP
jgi:hypothetical protein